jgi:hypothetical protein
LRALPSTGYTGFDENLKAIFDLDQQRAEDIVREANGDVSQIAAKIDQDALRGAVALEDEKLFQQFSRAHIRASSFQSQRRARLPVGYWVAF